MKCQEKISLFFALYLVQNIARKKKQKKKTKKKTYLTKNNLYKKKNKLLFSNTQLGRLINDLKNVERDAHHQIIVILKLVLSAISLIA